MPNNNNVVGIGPTGLQCLPRRQQGTYNIQPGSCIGNIVLGSGQTNAGGLTLAQQLKLPEEGHVLAPWVAIMFEGTGSVITVSNNSSPNTDPQNIACIESFEFGYSDGFTMRCTIQDQEGGSFVTFMQHLLKDYICLKKGSPAAVRMKFQFGWVKSGCPTPLPIAASQCYYALSDSVETHIHQGKITFEITGKDLCARMFEGGCSAAYGGEGEKAMPITEAIQQFMTQGCSPNVGSVRFLRMEGGQARECGWRDGTEDTSVDRSGNRLHPKGNKLIGPKGKWDCKGFNKMDVVLDWIKNHPTDRNLGWQLQYNSEEPNGELILWEDPKPVDAKDDSYWDRNCIGVYIVNGGHTSPVIEFNPKIRWDFARLTNNGGQLDSKTINATGQPGSRLPGERDYGLDARGYPCVGQKTQATMDETTKDLGTGTPGVVKGVNAQNRAMKILTDNIEADLVIVGDPTLCRPSEAMMAKNVTIIVVNPYYLRGGQPTANGLEWLAKPACNEVLTNKGWICKSISHKIELGKYTTTLGVIMTAGGVDTKPNAPLGNWTGGWHPTPQC